MHTFLTVVHVIVCVFLILVVLLQAGKGGGMGIAFGGSGSQTVFGSSGAGNFLTRLTAITAVVFMVTSLGLARYSSQQDSKRLQKLADQKAVDKKVEDEKADQAEGRAGEGRARPRRRRPRLRRPRPRRPRPPTASPRPAAVRRRRRQDQGQGRGERRQGREGQDAGRRSGRRAEGEEKEEGPARPKARPQAPRRPRPRRLQRRHRASRLQRWRCRSRKFRGWATTSWSSTCARDGRPRWPAGRRRESGGGAAALRSPLRRRRRRRAGHPAQRGRPTRACACSTPTAARPRCAATAFAASPRCCTKPTRRCAGRTSASRPAPACWRARSTSRTAPVDTVAVEMGRPQLARERDPAGRPADPSARCASRSRRATGRFRFTGVSMGNPHAVIFVDEPDADLRALADELRPGAGDRRPVSQAHQRRVRARRAATEIDLWVWERGSGLTMACGTGACATAVAAGLEERLAPGAETLVHLPGGTLGITVAKDYSGVVMRGPARTVFHGRSDRKRSLVAPRRGALRLQPDL